ncbi:MAG: type II/IV secretion system protein, partial [Kiritimatiellae bacterium]|nr:type II/IV secretion system protein [Kiritimatiellia bacterium]
SPPPALPSDPVALADHLFRAARLRHASDIHLDPGPDDALVRFRVDGILEPYCPVPAPLLPPLVSRIKVLAGMDIAERRAPQDGAFVLPALPSDPASATDVRVASLPVRHGERLTLRLLAADRQNLTLHSLGMSPAHLATIERLLQTPHGLFLLTGPTGSGKTTTLYAVIRRLLQLHPCNILTVEDPIEYEIPGVAQAEVDSSDKVSFAKALRSLLRHDPDVIMIGEIRDPESLDTAVKASLTGHLVLSTLHTNDAPGTISRLLDMGLEPHLAAATLRIAIAQRLVPRLCPACHEPYALSEEEALLLGHPELAGKTAYRPAGCLRCAGRGTLGRTALFEFFVPTPADAALVAQAAPPDALARQLASEGHRPLSADAIDKILSGLVPASAALRAL